VSRILEGSEYLKTSYPRSLRRRPGFGTLGHPSPATLKRVTREATSVSVWKRGWPDWRRGCRCGGDDPIWKPSGRSCWPSVILAKAKIRTGIYARGAVSFKLRLDLDEEEPERPGPIEAQCEAKGPAALSHCGPRLVEAVGIEPTSGNPPRQASTSIAGCLVLSPPIPPTGWLSGRPAPKSLAPHPRAGFGASPRNMTSEPAPR
jgi:hypothetical protein